MERREASASIARRARASPARWTKCACRRSAHPSHRGQVKERAQNPDANASRERKVLLEMRKADRKLDASAERQGAADFLRRAHDAAGLWRRCASKGCRRRRTCGGDVDECGARAFPEGWVWVHGMLQTLRTGRSPRAAMRGVPRNAIASEKDGGLGRKTRTVVVEFPGLGESFEMVVNERTKPVRKRSS